MSLSDESHGLETTDGAFAPYIRKGTAVPIQSGLTKYAGGYYYIAQID